MQTLFQQLGLPSEDEQIEAFIDKHSLGHSERIEQASFWTPAQAGFIKESYDQDSDWTELIDHLDTQLHK
jgi:hypothetical protein